MLNPWGTFALADPPHPPDPTRRSASGCPGWCNLPRCDPPELRALRPSWASLSHPCSAPPQSPSNPPVQPLVVSSASLWGRLFAVSFVPFSPKPILSFPFCFTLNIPLSGDLSSTTSLALGPAIRDSPTRPDPAHLRVVSSDLCDLEERPPGRPTVIPS
jgi:hypothetical protein